MKKNKPTELDNLVEQTKKREKIKKETIDKKWLLLVSIVTFVISFGLSFVANITIPNLALWLGIIVTLIFIFLGITFDMIGVAVTAAEESVFHSMNSRKVKSADVAVKLIKSAEKTSNFCCDVVGDICGIISGASGMTISNSIVNTMHTDTLLTYLFVTALVSAITIVGKAVGKSFAINKSDIILYEFAKIISIFYKK